MTSPLGAVRDRLGQELFQRVAGPEGPSRRDRIATAEGPRWFSDDRPIQQVHGDAAMFIGGIRALLLQSLHPLAMAGVAAHSGYRGDPWGRLQRTSRFLATTTYGTIADAERSIRIVRAIHKRVTGTTPTGQPYRADDPHLLGWIHVAEVDSFLTAYQVFASKPLRSAEADEYVRQSGFVAEQLGVVDPPQTVAEVDRLIGDYRPELKRTPAATEAADLLLKDPPLAGPHKLGYALLAAGAVSTLPPWARAMLLLPTLPSTDRLIARPLTRSALGTLRWALAGAPA